MMEGGAGRSLGSWRALKGAKQGVLGVVEAQEGTGHHRRLSGGRAVCPVTSLAEWVPPTHRDDSCAFAWLLKLREVQGSCLWLSR